MRVSRANRLLYGTPVQRGLEHGFVGDADLGRFLLGALDGRNVFRGRIDDFLRLQVRGELHLERSFLPGGHEGLLLRREARDGDGLEHRLVVRPNVERKRVGAGGFRHGVRHRRERGGVPVQVLVRVRMGQRNLDLQGFRLRKLRNRDRGVVLVPDGQLVRRRNQGGRRHLRDGRGVRLDVFRPIRRDRRDLFVAEEARRRLRFLGRRRPRFGAFGEPLFRLNGFRRHGDGTVELDVRGREFGKFRELFGDEGFVYGDVERKFLNPVGSFAGRHLQHRCLNLAHRDPHRIFLQRMVHGDVGRNPNNFSHRDYRGRDLLRAMDATDVRGFGLVLNECERSNRIGMLSERDGGFGMSVLANGNSVRNGLQQRDGDPYELRLFDDDERSREPYGERYERGGKLFGEFADLHLYGEARDWD